MDDRNLNVMLDDPGVDGPSHKELPDSDGLPVENFYEKPQGTLLTSAIRPVLEKLHTDGHYIIGEKSGIYWLLTDPPLEGCKAPDWFYVPNVPPMLEGETRRSYVMWREIGKPLLIIENISRDGSEEYDTTPTTGKFWVYERGISASYYAIWDPKRLQLEVYELIRSRYRRMAPNERGHVPIIEMEAELGLWEGHFAGITLTWLRFFDQQGRLIPIPDEMIEQATQEVTEARKQADETRKQATKERLDRERAEQLANKERLDRERAEVELKQLLERLREKGIDPETLHPPSGEG
jgi:Uma2 family endonuclease